MKTKKKKSRKIIIGRVYDLVLIAMYIILSFLFLNAIRSYTRKYMFAAFFILIVVLAILLLTLGYRKKTVDIFRRIFMTLLCALLLFVSLKINSLNRFFDQLGMDQNETEEKIKVQMNLYSLKSSEHFTEIISTLEDMEGKTIGIQISSDKESAEEVLPKIQKNYQVEVVEYSDYNSMVNDLYYGYVDSILVNVNALEGIETTFGTMSEFTNLIHSYNFTQTIYHDYNNKDITKEMFTVLISGQDDTGTPCQNSLSDVNMLAMIDPISNQIILVSIPRDAYVPNPVYNNQNDKLTHTGMDGISNTMESLEKTFQIDIDFYVKISFTSLIEIVNAVDGVEVDIPIYIEEQDENRSFAGEDLIRLNPGIQTLNGKEALAFARHRHSYANQDVGRTEAQMQIIKGIIRKLLSSDGLTSKIEKVLDIVPKYVLTNFSNTQMKSFIRNEIDELKPWKIATLSMANGYAPGPEGYAVTATSPGELLSVYYLNKIDVKNVNAAYQLLKEANSFEDFHFDISDLYAGLEQYENSNVYLYDAATGIISNNE